MAELLESTHQSKCFYTSTKDPSTHSSLSEPFVQPSNYHRVTFRRLACDRGQKPRMLLSSTSGKTTANLLKIRMLLFANGMDILTMYVCLSYGAGRSGWHEGLGVWKQNQSPNSSTTTGGKCPRLQQLRGSVSNLENSVYR
ncbi:hypothetical protein FA13DRAFT_1413867 [Coprinellus micaceus]|uniref:Uncharacterized protein n=1 Tax=Coprinellus micaceus TaxID=71717 RepID=A0A4Y7SP01_COPMI|nr:hypothetical protein FA13DRAFT_1413867 [Coprinellus micaceus]